MTKQINWDEIKFRASSWGNLMSEPQAKAAKERGELSKTCQKELIKIYCQEIYGRKKDITTSQMEKGTQAEPESIVLFNRVEGKAFVKNEEELENEWAKQQAIAFNEFVEINYTGNCQIGYYTSKDETKLSVEQVYNQFIEQQNVKQ